MDTFVSKNAVVSKDAIFYDTLKYPYIKKILLSLIS